MRVPEPVQSSLLIAAVVCAVLALLVGLWLAVQVSSLRRHRFISARVLAGATDGGGSQRRSMSSRQGQARRYTAPAVRTGVDSVTLKRALDRAASRQEKSLSAMRAEVERLKGEVKRVSEGFGKVQQQASTDTQSIKRVHSDATQNLQRMTTSVEAMEKRVDGKVSDLDERVGRTVAEVHERLAELSAEVEQLEARRAALGEEQNADRSRLDTLDRGLGGVADIVDQLERTTSEHGTRVTAVDERLGALGGSMEEHGARVERLEGGASQITERTEGLDQALRQLSGNADNLDQRLKRLEHSTTSALTEVALVRYDAFGDMGGRMSFSVALLDGVGDGLVITSLNGRAHSQTYAKSVTEGRGTTALTDEEAQAVAAARGLEAESPATEAVRPLRQARR